MSVEIVKTKVILNGNDVVTTFPYDFKVLKDADMRVIHTDAAGLETILVQDTHYTLTGVGDESGGDVEYPISGDELPTGEKLTLYRRPAFLQLMDLHTQGGFRGETLEDAFDLLTMLAQVMEELTERSITIPVSDDSGASLELADGAEAGKALMWNPAGDAIINVDPGSVTLAIPADLSVTTAKLVALAVTAAKIANDTITAAKLDATDKIAMAAKLEVVQKAGDIMTGALKTAKGADVAAASTLPYNSDGNYKDVTGSAGIAAIATSGTLGTILITRFTGAPLLTHSANLDLLGDVDYQVTASDTIVWVEYAAGDWTMVGLLNNNGITGTGKDVRDTSPTITTPKIDQIDEATGGVGVTLDSVVAKDGEIAEQYLGDIISAAGSILLVSANNEQFSNSDTYEKVKEIKLGNIKNELRVSFDLKKDNSGNAYGRIYRNGVAVGTERITSSTSYVNYSEDLSGWSEGDTVELWIHRDSIATAYVQNFHVRSNRSFWDPVVTTD